MHIPIAKKYIAGIFFKYLLLSLGIFAGLMMMVNFMQLVHSGALSGFSFYFLSKSILHLLPNVIGLCLPISFLLAVLLSLGQMSQDGEIIALRAGGYSFFSIFSWVFFVALACSVLLFHINNEAGPRGISRSKHYGQIMLQRISHIGIKPRTFQKLSDWSLYADDVNSITGQMTGVKLIQRTEKDSSSIIMLMNAEKGWYGAVGDKGMLVRLDGGQFSQTDTRNPGNNLNGTFSSYETVLNFFSGTSKKKRKKDEITSRELLEIAKSGVLDEEDTAEYKCEAVSRMALSLGPFLLFLVGVPLGVSLDKRGKPASFAFSLVILFCYYGLSIGGMMFTRKNMDLYPWPVFIPAVLTFIVGIILWRKRLSTR